MIFKGIDLDRILEIMKSNNEIIKKLYSDYSFEVTDNEDYFYLVIYTECEIKREEDCETLRKLFKADEVSLYEDEIKNEFFWSIEWEKI